MATFLFDQIVFGPIYSRRLGSSLGINLLPINSKLCNYNCIYCECGWSKENTDKTFPSFEEVSNALEKYFWDTNKKTLPDVITFAGNGEPSLHPQFSQIIELTIQLRNKYLPNTKISVLTNATQLHKPEVANALQKIELAMLKIDTVIQEDYEFLNCQKSNYKINDIIKNIKNNIEKPIIQTMFLKVETANYSFDNTSESSLNQYIDVLEFLSPQNVILYTISRDTPMDNIQAISNSQLNLIAQQLQKRGINCSVTK